MSIQDIMTIHQVAYREKQLAKQLVEAIEDQRFEYSEIENYSDASSYKVQCNLNSCYVFAVDEDYNCLMMNGDTADLFLFTPYEGHEGFLSELLDELKPDDLNSEDVEYLKRYAEGLDIDLDEYENWKVEAE